nr:hypothetical protein [Tanacetum cinerariifolium]
MSSQFEISNLGELTYYLGIEVSQEKNCVEIKQERYAMKILKEAGTISFGIEYKRGNDMSLMGYNSHNVDIDDGRSTIGHLFYLAIAAACQAIWLREALNVDNTVIEEVDSFDKTSMSSVQEEGQSSTLLVEKINMFEQQPLVGKCVILDDDAKPLEKIDYIGDHDSEDEVKPIDNDMERFVAFKPSGVGYGQKIPENIQSVCDNLDIKVRGRKKK